MNGLKRIKKTWKWVVGFPVALFFALFLVLWAIGPAPVSMGPYVQNVTVSSAEVCAFDEIACRLQVELTAPGVDRVVVTERSAVCAHRAKFTGLNPDTRYQYVISLTDAEASRFTGSFKTAPLAKDRPFQFVAVGDSGDVPNWFKLHRYGFGRLRSGLKYLERTGQWDVGQWIAAKEPDFFVHLGDVIYSHNQLPAYQEAFFRPFGPVLARCPLVSLFGNHDLHDWKHPEFFRVFHTPKTLDPKKAYEDYSYSYVWGGVRFLVLDLYYQQWDEGSEMRIWLESTLRSNRQPRTIVVSNYPPFTEESAVKQKDNLVFQKIWPLLVKHKVNLVVGGNTHSYQRFKPVDGVTVVIAGTGGKSVRPIGRSDRLAHAEERFGFLLVKIDGTRIEGEFWTGDSKPADSFLVIE